MTVVLSYDEPLHLNCLFLEFKECIPYDLSDLSFVTGGGNICYFPESKEVQIGTFAIYNHFYNDFDENGILNKPKFSTPKELVISSLCHEVAHHLDCHFNPYVYSKVKHYYNKARKRPNSYYFSLFNEVMHSKETFLPLRNELHSIVFPRLFNKPGHFGLSCY